MGPVLVLFIHLLVSVISPRFRVSSQCEGSTENSDPDQIIWSLATLQHYINLPLDYNIWLLAQQRCLAFWTVQSPLHQWKHYIYCDVNRIPVFWSAWFGLTAATSDSRYKGGWIFKLSWFYLLNVIKKKEKKERKEWAASRMAYLIPLFSTGCRMFRWHAISVWRFSSKQKLNHSGLVSSSLH